MKSLFGKKKLTGKWVCDLRLSVLATLDLAQASELIAVHKVTEFGRRGSYTLVGDTWHDYKPRKLVLEINYPLDALIQLTVSPVPMPGTKRGMTSGFFCWTVAQAYDKIFADPLTWGVLPAKSHSFGQLVLEGLEVSPKGVVKLKIGS